MLSSTIQSAIGKQINHEFNAAYHYLAVATWCDARNFPGFAKWMRKQATEEIEHAMKFYGYVHDRGGTVELDAIAKPKVALQKPIDCFRKGLEMEQANTKAIHGVFALAVSEKDYATQSMLKWFIDEQVEEEKSMSDVIAMLEMAGDSSSALLMLDHKLGERGGE